jgi:SAM-dependent methyltransferase
MTVFGNYAQYYDLLYQDKNYAQEAEFIIQLLKTHAPEAENLLELGSGTGRHAEYLLKAGYHVHGIERSTHMLNLCKERLTRLGSDYHTAFQVTTGDIADIALGKTFDVVLALFHVISYQVSNAALTATFSRVKQHLKPGGVFIFDTWYGPAVLQELPTPRLKRVENQDYEIIRFANPTLYPNENRVDVNYEIFAREKASQRVESFQELHAMRYLFMPELDLIASHFELQIVAAQEWMTHQNLSQGTWNAYFVMTHR